MDSRRKCIRSELHWTPTPQYPKYHPVKPQKDFCDIFCFHPDHVLSSLKTGVFLMSPASSFPGYAKNGFHFSWISGPCFVRSPAGWFLCSQVPFLGPHSEAAQAAERTGRFGGFPSSHFLAVSLSSFPLSVV